MHLTAERSHMTSGSFCVTRSHPHATFTTDPAVWPASLGDRQAARPRGDVALEDDAGASALLTGPLRGRRTGLKDQLKP